jgi:outer membrane lipoprotein carrier protein
VYLRTILQLDSCAIWLLSLCPFLWSQKAVLDSSEQAKRTDARQIVRRLEAKYRGAARLEATFLERYTENGELTRLEAGKVYFERPGKMRWEYESPEKNVFVVDGKHAWFYVPADHTVTRVPAKRSTDWRTPLALLVGEMKVSRICNRIGLAERQTPEYSADVLLYCEPRGASNLREGGDSGRKADSPGGRDMVYLEVEERSGELVRVLVSDPGGVGIEFRFANWQLHPQLDDSFFRFQVPPGVTIVNGELGAAQKMTGPTPP